MKRHPIHQNLSTTFVDLPALIRHLRDLQFVGTIRVEHASYEGEIIFTGSPKLRAREYDYVTGRISMGESALVRILHHAREPYGRIHVLQSADGRAEAEIYIDERITAAAWDTIAGRGDTLARQLLKTDVSATGDARLDLLSEMLFTIDRSLAGSGLSFPAAFSNACERLAGQYEFFDPERRKVWYADGRLITEESLDHQLLIEAVGQALLAVFGRLTQEPRLSAAYEAARQSVLLLTLQHQTAYESLAISEQLDKLIGIK